MRVLLVDDQRLFREGLCALLKGRSDVEVAGHAASAREAYAWIARQHPDLVVTELLLPGSDGVATVREIRRLQPECKLLALTGCRESQRLQAAWLCGIDACVSKQESVHELFAALASLKAGHRYLSPSLRSMDLLMRSDIKRRDRDGDPMSRLSRREREVFDMVVRGFTTKGVAQELCISIKTVETHRAHINEKLAAHSSADLVRFAFLNGDPSALPPGAARKRRRS
jgi:two-component system, NarL family, response regulator NreC